MAFAIAADCRRRRCRAGAAQDAQAPGLRLPRDVVPLAYAPHLTIDPGAERFSGSIDIKVRVDRPTTLVWLNARNLTLESARFVSATAAAESVDATIEKGSDDVVGLRFARPLPAGEATLSIRYSGTHRERQRDRRVPPAGPRRLVRVHAIRAAGRATGLSLL